MELIRIFTGILLVICLISFSNTQNENKSLKAQERYTQQTMHKTPLGLSVIDFKGKVRVEDVQNYSPASNAGIEIGDKILEIEKNKINTTENFFEAIENLYDKETINMTIYRVDSQSKFPVIVDKSAYIIR